jgi:hypothetical protein
MNLLLVMFVALAGAQTTGFRLVLLTTEGGINPGEERITIEADGSVIVRTWRLSQASPLEERWAVSPDVVGTILDALEEADFPALPEVLNEARGSVVAFSTSMEVVTDGSRHTVTAYRHGSPPPPEEFVALARLIRESVLAARPSPPGP